MPSATSNGAYAPISIPLTVYCRQGDQSFEGLFDGQGKTISSLTLGSVGPNPGDPSWRFMGLFGEIGSNGVVRNLNVNAVGDTGIAWDYVGVLAGVNNAAIYAVSVSGKIMSSNPNLSGHGLSAGGLVGDNFGTITRSSSSVDVSAGPIAGGLGSTNEGVITQSFATGMQTQVYNNGAGDTGAAGGLVGYNIGTITKSYATGPIIYENDFGHLTNIYWNTDTTGATAASNR